MIIKKVNRYYCEYCKKSNCSKSSIRKHEEHCTMNPNRICGVCEMLKEGDGKERLKNALEFLSPLKGQTPYTYCDEDGLNFSRMDPKISRKLRDITDNCPACIMAALRQSDIPVGYMDDFNFKGEMDSIFSDMREDFT